jgi:hypothetical protein
MVTIGPPGRPPWPVHISGRSAGGNRPHGYPVGRPWPPRRRCGRGVHGPGCSRGRTGTRRGVPFGSPHVAASNDETAVGRCNGSGDRPLFETGENGLREDHRNEFFRGQFDGGLDADLHVCHLLSEARPAFTPKIRIPENARSVCRRLEVRSSFSFVNPRRGRGGTEHSRCACSSHIYLSNPGGPTTVCPVVPTKVRPWSHHLGRQHFDTHTPRPFLAHTLPTPRPVRGTPAARVQPASGPSAEIPGPYSHAPQGHLPRGRPCLPHPWPSPNQHLTHSWHHTSERLSHASPWPGGIIRPYCPNPFPNPRRPSPSPAPQPRHTSGTPRAFRVTPAPKQLLPENKLNGNI